MRARCLLEHPLSWQREWGDPSDDAAHTFCSWSSWHRQFLRLLTVGDGHARKSSSWDIFEDLVQVTLIYCSIMISMLLLRTEFESDIGHALCLSVFGQGHWGISEQPRWEPHVGRVGSWDWLHALSSGNTVSQALLGRPLQLDSYR